MALNSEKSKTPNLKEISVASDILFEGPTTQLQSTRDALAGSRDSGGRYMPSSLFRGHAILILRSKQKYFNLFIKILNSFTIRILLIGNFYYYLLLVIFNSRIKLKSFFGPTFESELNRD